MQITINEYDHPETLRAVAVLLNTLAERNTHTGAGIGAITAAVSTTDAQPAVARNTGSSTSVPSLSTEGAAVSEGVDVAGETPEAKSTPSASEKPKRGRKPKEETVSGAETAQVSEHAQSVSASATAPTISEEAATIEPDAAEVPAASSTLTLDDVRAALQKFTAAKGIPAGIELLGQFGAARVSEVKAEDFAAFVEKCGA